MWTGNRTGGAVLLRLWIDRFAEHTGSSVRTGSAAAAATQVRKPARKLLRMSRRLIIVLSVLGVLVIGGAAGALILTNLLRGGADSPEQAVTKSLEAVGKKDLAGLFTMVSPHERDALVRVQDAVMKKAKDEEIVEAAQSVSSKNSGQAGSELTFDGIDVTFTGINPTVSQVSDDAAVVRLSSGEIKLHVDPAQTTGAARTIFDSFENVGTTDQTWNISDLGPSRSGLSVLATKKDGRWYVNLAMSVLEAVNSYQGSPRGLIPPSSQGGSDNPQTAARTAVLAAQTRSPSQVAPFLVEDEADVMYLYGHLWDEFTSSSSSFSFGNVDFTEGPHDGNRAQAYVNQINVNTGRGDKFTLTDKCINDGSSSQEGNCLNGSAYQSSGYGGGVNWISALAHDGKFALTTVKEDGKWKVSLLDTAVDHMISALNSLSHEQLLALTSLPRSDASSGSVSLGESKDLEFNNAGYAVATLKLDKATKLELDKKSTVNGVSVYSSDGKTSVGWIASSGQNGTTYDAGEYKLVAWGGSNFREAFQKDGNSARTSAAVKISEYVEPATIDGSTTTSSTRISDQSKPFRVKVPTASAGALQVTIDSAPSSDSTIVATVDGQSYPVDAGSGKVTAIPLGVGNHTMTLRTVEKPSSSRSYYYDYAYVDLSFENQ